MKVTKSKVGFLLTVLVFSLFLPVSSSRFFWRKDVLTTPEIVQAGMMESITVESDGHCTLDIIMNVSSLLLVDIYKRAFGFNSSYQDGNYHPVPENISVVRYQNFAWNESEIDDAYEDPVLDVNGRIYPRDSLCNGTFQQQLLCLGIEITDFSNVEMKHNSSGFFTHIHANGFFVQYGGESTVCVGPSNWNMSCDRANLVLTEIGFIQQMLGEYSGEQIYHNNWITAITTPAITNPDDIPNYWSVNFGGGTSIEATSSLLGNTVMLVEDLWVSEQNITKTEHKLLEEERFLCYKIFNIKYASGLGGRVSRSACVDDLTWGFDLPSFTITCPTVGVKFSDPDDKVTVDFRFNFSLTVTGHVQLKTKWFKFRKFEAWLQAEGDLWVKFNASYTGTFWEKTWERHLCEWPKNKSRPYTFWVGPVPVVVRPRIRIIARLYVKFEGTVWISCEARTDGLIRLGAGWKRHKGFYGIFKAGMTVTEFKPDYGGNVEVTVTPSVGFRPSLLFYETVGPAVELEPYLKVHWYDHDPPNGNWDNDTILGINVSVGIDFSGWIKKITGLHDYDWTIRDWVLWEYPNREDNDVAVTDVRIPPETVYNDIMNVTVFVLNVGKSDENIKVTLYYDDGSGWVKFDCVQNPKQIQLPARDYTTVDFTCYTEGMTYTDDPGGTPYPVKAEAEITHDDNDSNNRCTGEFNLTFLNVAIIDLTTYWNQTSQEYEIAVTVKNTGTTNASAVPIFVYKNGEPISDVWCEAMTIMFDLQPKQQRTHTFYSDTNQHLTAQIVLLLYETISLDNKLPPFVGDVNDDGTVDMADISRMIDAFMTTRRDSTWDRMCDVNDDGSVDMADISIAIGNFMGTW